MPGNGSETRNGGLQRDRAEVLPPLLERTLDETDAIQLEHVEDGVRDREPRARAMLQGLKRWMTRRIQSHDLAVKDN